MKKMEPFRFGYYTIKNDVGDGWEIETCNTMNDETEVWYFSTVFSIMDVYEGKDADIQEYTTSDLLEALATHNKILEEMRKC